MIFMIFHLENFEQFSFYQIIQWYKTRIVFPTNFYLLFICVVLYIFAEKRKLYKIIFPNGRMKNEICNIALGF